MRKRGCMYVGTSIKFISIYLTVKFEYLVHIYFAPHWGLLDFKELVKERAYLTLICSCAMSRAPNKFYSYLSIKKKKL